MRTRGASVVVGVLALAQLFAACGDDASTDVDAGGPPPDDAGFVPDAGWRVPVVPPTPPQLTPCPAGWREVTSSGTEPTTCDPWPAGGASPCPSGQAQLPGEPACRRIGSACPAAGEFAADLPATGTIVYVRAGATAGDGSRAAPFGTITEALAMASAGTTVALAAGTYSEEVILAAPVTIWGACASGTTLTNATASATGGVVTVRTSDATLRDVRIADTPRIGVWLRGAGFSLTMRSVLVEHVSNAAIDVEGGALLEADELVVRDTQSVADIGRGIDVEGASSATIRHAVFERNVEAGTFAHGVGTTLILQDTVASDTLAKPSTGLAGVGVAVFAGAHVDAARVVVERNRQVGLYVTGTGSHLSVDGAMVRDTLPQPLSMLYGRGLNTEGGGSAEIRHATFERNRDINVLVGHGTLLLEDSVVRDTLAQMADHAHGRGVDIDIESTGQLARVWIGRSLEAGMLIGSPTTTADLSDVSVSATRSLEPGAMNEGTNGRGIIIEAGARVHAERLDVSSSHQVGVFVAQDGTSLDATDVRVSDTVRQECSMAICGDVPAGIGLGVYDTSAVTLERFEITRSAQCGLQLARGGAVDLTTGEVSFAEIGACLQVPGYDVARLSDRVVYHDNTSANLDTTHLPVPAATTPTL